MSRARLKLHAVSGAIAILLFLLFPTESLAHPGNTDSSGGHTCRTNCPSWGLDYGDYHYHGGYYEDEEDEEYYAPARIQTYSWKGRTFYSYESYYKARWDDIQALYRELLGRNFHTQEEGKIHTSSGDSYELIRLKILASDERKQYIDRQIQQKVERIQAVADTPYEEAKTSVPKTPWYIELWWLVLYLIYLVGSLINEKLKEWRASK